VVQRQISLDRTFAALADPTRRAILERLSHSSIATVSDLAEPFDITLTGLRKHLLVLEEVELIATEKIGRRRQCRLGPRKLDDAGQWIAGYQRMVEARFDRLSHKGRDRSYAALDRLLAEAAGAAGGQIGSAQLGGEDV
jgi:DNA-binding transcriptional ArsR family regulator